MTQETHEVRVKQTAVSTFFNFYFFYQQAPSTTEWDDSSFSDLHLPKTEKRKKHKPKTCQIVNEHNKHQLNSWKAYRIF